MNAIDIIHPIASKNQKPGGALIRKPHIRSFRIDDDTLKLVNQRYGPNRRLKTLSSFVREGIELRLKQEDPWTGWLVERQENRS